MACSRMTSASTPAPPDATPESIRGSTWLSRAWLLIALFACWGGDRRQIALMSFIIWFSFAR